MKSLCKPLRQWLGWQFTGGSNYVLFWRRTWECSNSVNSFFDLDQIAPIERSRGLCIFNFISCRRLLNIFILATKSPRGAKRRPCTKMENSKFSKNWNARFSVSNDIDFWSRKIHMAEKCLPKLKNCSSGSFLLLNFKRIENFEIGWKYNCKILRIEWHRFLPSKHSYGWEIVFKNWETVSHENAENQIKYGQQINANTLFGGISSTSVLRRKPGGQFTAGL